MYISELNITVENIYNFNEEANKILTDFCEDLVSKGLTREIDEEADSFQYELQWSFIWLPEGKELIKREINRLYSIGVKYFGMTNDLHISSHMYRES